MTNTGTRAGDEVVQLYVRYPESKVAAAAQAAARLQAHHARAGRDAAVDDPSARPATSPTGTSPATPGPSSPAGRADGRRVVGRRGPHPAENGRGRALVDVEVQGARLEARRRTGRECRRLERLADDPPVVGAVLDAAHQRLAPLVADREGELQPLRLSDAACGRPAA